MSYTPSPVSSPARPNEQIYNNATERTKIIYVGSLAGVVPGGPGHSHQAIRDISALAAMPGMTLVEPSCEAEVGPLLNWCINEAPGSSYIRLASLPCDIHFQPPKGWQPVLGQGIRLVEGSDVVVISYGPVLLSGAVEAARIFAEKDNLSVKVINLPWLNEVDVGWLKREVLGCKWVFSLDNHYIKGGQGDTIARAMAGIEGMESQLINLGIENIPPSGTNPQVLKQVGLDVNTLVQSIMAVAFR